MGRTACTEPQCLYKGALCLFYLKVYCNNFPINLHGAETDIFTFYMRLDLQSGLRPSDKNLKEDPGTNRKVTHKVISSI